MAINNTLSGYNAASATQPFQKLLGGLAAPAGPYKPPQLSSPLSTALTKASGASPNMSVYNPATVYKPPATATAKLPTSIVGSTSSTPKTVAPSDGGSTYQGVAITPGTDASNKNSSTGTGSSSSVTGLLTPPVPPSTQQQTGPSYSGLVSTILDRTAHPSQPVQDAYNAQQTANANLEHFRESVADTTKGIYSAPTSARVMQGRDAALQNANASKEAALGSQLTSATNLYNAAQTGQGQQLNALTSTLSQVGPQLGAYGQTYYNPLDPSSGGNASGITSGWASFLAGGGDPSQVPATVSSNPVLWQQTLQAAKQQNPSFDVNTALGQAASRQSNASTAGSTVLNTAAQGYQTTTQNYNQMTAVNSAAHTQSLNLKNILDKTGINASDPTLFNKGLNTLQRNFSSTDYASFTTALAELQNMYGQLLQTGGGTPTGNEQQALNVLNANSSASAISAAISQLEQASYAKLQAQYTQANGYLQQLQGGDQGGMSNAGAGTGGNSGTISTSIGNFVKDANGNWIVAK